jgi:hypothetical protein
MVPRSQVINVVNDVLDNVVESIGTSWSGRLWDVLYNWPVMCGWLNVQVVRRSPVSAILKKSSGNEQAGCVVIASDAGSLLKPGHLLFLGT